jgi:hypothetical protein
VDLSTVGAVGVAVLLIAGVGHGGAARAASTNGERFTNYIAPTGPEMTPEQVQSVAVLAARRAASTENRAGAFGFSSERWSEPRPLALRIYAPDSHCRQLGEHKGKPSPTSSLGSRSERSSGRENTRCGREDMRMHIIDSHECLAVTTKPDYKEAVVNASEHSFVLWLPGRSREAIRQRARATRQPRCLHLSKKAAECANDIYAHEVDC